MVGQEYHPVNIPGVGGIFFRKIPTEIVNILFSPGHFIHQMVEFPCVIHIKSLFKEMEPGLYPLEKYLERIMQEDLSVLFYLIVAFAVIWVYSVADAFWVGLKIEKRAGGDLK